MDVTDNDRFSMNSLLPGGEARPPHMREEERHSEPAETGERFNVSSRVMRQLARSLADAAEMREAKILAFAGTPDQTGFQGFPRFYKSPTGTLLRVEA